MCLLDCEMVQDASLDTKIAFRMEMKWIVQGKHRIVRTSRTVGSASIEAKDHLLDCVIGCFHVGHPVRRQNIILKANIISAQTTGQTSGGDWYHRFLELHPELVLWGDREFRIPQSLVLKVVWTGNDLC